MQAQMIRAYVNQTFDKYDVDKSGTLDEEQLTLFFNDLFKTLGINTVVTKQQSLEAIRSIDQNSDGKVDREELFAAFQKMLGSPPPSTISQSYPQPPRPNPTSYQPYQFNSNMYSSYHTNPSHQYPPPPPPPPPGYHTNYNNYPQSTFDEYGMQNPYMNQPNPYSNPHYPQYPQQKLHNQNHYQAPYNPYQGEYPPEQQPPYNPYSNPYMNNGKAKYYGGKWNGP